MISSTASFQILETYLVRNGYTLTPLELRGTDNPFVAISSTIRPGKLVINTKNPTYPFGTTSARRIFKDKHMAYAYVRSLNITTPESKTVKAYSSDLDDFFNSYGRFIVKPVSAQGGKGLCLNITTRSQLENAINNATQFSSNVLVQHQFIGEEVRFTTVDGVVISALLRQKPMVIGNGHSTIEQLIHAENESRRALIESLVTYPILDEKLVEVELLYSQSVPPENERVELGLGTMIKNGASIYNVIDTIHPSYITLIEKIAQTFGRGFAAIDMMITNINVAATDNNYIFLEMNSDPALVLYYSCRDNKNVDIVEQHIGPLFLRALEGDLHD